MRPGDGSIYPRLRMRFPYSLTACLLCIGGAAASGAQEAPALRDPVHPGRNVEEFAPVETRRVRFTILKTSNDSQPCIDEWEVYGPDSPDTNLALAATGTRARASGTYPEYRIHAISHINDGRYGNGHSWIPDSPASPWAELEFPSPVVINRMVWSRDRERKFIDRLPVEYRIEAAREDGTWQVVASSADRAALPVMPETALTGFGLSVPFGEMSTEGPGADRPAAREYLLKTWQTADGLPASTVTSLVQTRDGWLWVGTTNGLARFDGTRFTVFGESRGLPNLHITCLHEDPSGTLWAGTAGGGVVRRENGGFRTLPTGSGLPAGTVLAITGDDDGNVWIGTQTGLLRYRDGEMVPVSREGVDRLACSGDRLWMIRDTVLYYWDGSRAVRLLPELDPSAFSSMSALAPGGDGAVWFAGANGYVGHLSGNQVTPFGEGHSVLTSHALALLDTGSELWIGTSATGLARLRGQSLLHLTTDDGLPSNGVRALCQDNEGNLWVGTAGGGLTRLRPRQVRAVTTRDGLSHNGIMAMAEDADGNVWIGTNGGGLNRWDGIRARPQTPTYALENKSIPSLAITRDGAFWLGTAGNGAFRLHNGEVTHVSTDEGLPGQVITALCEDRGGILRIGTLDGGIAGHADGRILPPEEDALREALPVTCMAEDPQGRLWIGTAGQGVIRRAPDGTVARWHRDNGLASNFMRTLRIDEDGTVWAGTHGGLTRWRNDRIHNFTPADGLPDAAVSQILNDGEGNLWLGTGGGITRVSRASLDAVAEGTAPALVTLDLGTEDGLPALECTGGYHPAGLRTRNGLLCFGTVGGLAVIDPAGLRPGAAGPPAVLESVTVDAAVHEMPEEGILAIPPSAGRLSFAFTALSYSHPNRTRFRYRLTAFDRDWQDAGRTRTATYTHLPPGTYRFEVEASTDGSTWSPTPARLEIRVAAPWWRHPVSIAAGCLAGIAAVAGLARSFTRRRMQRRLREIERQFALERERSRIARDIHDDLGASLTRIGLLSALGQQQRHDPEAVRDHFATIATTSQELVQAMDSIVWAVNPAQDTLEGLARYLVRFAGDCFAPSATRLRVDVPPELPPLTLSSELRHNLFLAAKEALHNALHHAGAREVCLRIASTGPRIEIVIADDGRGFSPETAEDGSGLTNMHHRLTESGGTCRITSEPGRGTTVRLEIAIPPQRHE